MRVCGCWVGEKLLTVLLGGYCGSLASCLDPYWAGIAGLDLGEPARSTTIASGQDELPPVPGRPAAAWLSAGGGVGRVSVAAIPLKRNITSFMLLK